MKTSIVISQIKKCDNTLKLSLDTDMDIGEITIGQLSELKAQLRATVLNFLDHHKTV